MSWQYHAQNIRTGKWLDHDLPLSGVQLTLTLSGPPQLTGKLAPEWPALLDDRGDAVLLEWQTAIYAEADGILRFGGLLVHSAPEDGGGWSLECSGFSSYLKNTPYLGTYSKDSVDPLVVARELWRYAQAQPDAALGVVVDTTTSPVRLGKTPKHTILGGENTGTGSTTEGEEPTPYALNWWEAKDCGDELDELAKQTPFDYLEEHSWIDRDSYTIEHRIRLGYPRFGRKRSDLRFVLGENLTAVPTPEIAGDDFCNEVLAIGKGEGSEALRATVAERDERLRRVRVVTYSDVDNKDRLTQLARQELNLHNPLLQLTEVKIADHPNARLGDYSVGDDILIQGGPPWQRSLNLWVRITSAAIEPESADAAATLTVARSDSFTYGEIWQ